MALEWTLLYELEPPVPMTVANATGIEKGTLLALSDPNTAAAVGATDNAIIAGVAAEEKIASDGKTKLAVYRRGIFKCTAGGSITVGDMVESSSGAANEVITATFTAAATANIIGRALETAADTDTLMVELMPMQIKDPA